MTPSSSRHPYRLSLVAYGVALLLRADDEELLQHAAAHLPFGSLIVPEHTKVEPVVFTLLRSTDQKLYRIRQANRSIATSPVLEKFLDTLYAYLMVAVAEFAPDHLFIHAGVVGWQGKAILLPGSSFAGKTTLTAELVRAGATYYSDEYALIDKEGMIHPFARDLQMRLPGKPEQSSLRVDELGGTAAIHPAPASAILFVEYKSGSTWSPQPVSPAMAVLEMLRHAPAIRRIPADAMQMLSRVTQAAPAFRSLRGEAPEAAAFIMQQF